MRTITLKRKLLLWSIFSIFSISQLYAVQIGPNETAILDENFERELIIQGLDDVIDGRVLTSNISSVQVLDVEGENISDLTGIQDFNNLTSLNCSNNQLTVLDVSNNTELTFLDCAGNSLTNLDLSENLQLTELECNHNQLTDLNLNNNTELISLICYRNQLTTLDVRSNTQLKELRCYANQLTSLNIDNLVNLTMLRCGENSLSNVDVRSNINLSFISCGSNQLRDIDISNNVQLVELHCSRNQLIGLDLSSNTQLEVLHCSSNELQSLNLDQNNLIRSLECSRNELTSLDLSNKPNLRALRCHVNKLESIIVHNSTSLVELWFYMNRVNSIDLSTNTNLEELRFWYNGISNVDLSNNVSLTTLICANTNLTSLDLSANVNLSELNCSSTQLTALNLNNGNITALNPNDFNATDNPQLTCISVNDVAWANANLTDIDPQTSFSISCIEYTQIPDPNFEQALINLGHDSGTIDGVVPTENIDTITELVVNNRSISDLTGIEDFVSLTVLECDNNNLNTLDVSNLVLLEELSFDRNNITSIDVSNLSNLRQLSGWSNQLESLDVTNNTQLEILYIWDNALTTLDVSTNLQLRTLMCNDNNLTSFDISNNTQLAGLTCSGNNFTGLDISNNLLLDLVYAQNLNITSLDLSQHSVLRVLYVDNNNLTSLDLSNNPLLTHLRVENNQLEELNVNNGAIENMNTFNFNTTNNPSLTCISVNDVAWANTNLTDIDPQTNFNTNCASLYTQIPDANFEQALIDLGHDDVLDGRVVTSNVDGLTELRMYNKNIVSISGIEDFIALESLEVDNNSISSVDVSMLTQLRSLSLDSNNLTSIDVSDLAQLELLSVWSNEIDTINVSNNPNLRILYVWDNNLTSLDVTTNVLLQNLFCDNNQLVALDVSNNPQLVALTCSDNNFSGLDISNNLQLDILYAQGLNINSLDLSQHSVLRTLYVDNNNLTSLDLSNNPLLTHLHVENNQLTELNVNNGAIANMNVANFVTTNNPNLTCIEVDDVAWSEANLTNIDTQTSFSENCGPIGIRVYARKESAANAPLIHAWPNITEWDTKPTMEASTEFSGYYVYEAPVDRTEISVLFIFDGVQTEDQTGITQDTWFEIAADGTISRSTTPPANPLAPVVTSSDSATFVEGTTQTITATATLGASIRYTFSSTGIPADPGVSSPVYSGPITVNEDVTYKFVAYSSGFASNIAMTTYTFVEEQPGIRIYARKEGTTNAPLIHAWPELTAWDNKPTMAASSEYPDYFVYEVPADRTEVNALFVFDGVKTGDQTGITQDTWFTVASNGFVSSTTIPPTPPTTPVLTVSNGGIFAEGTTQLLNASATLNAEIYYTMSTTGTPADPTRSSNLYAGAISVSADATYKLIAFNGEHPSTVATVSYTFVEEQPGIRIYVRKEGTTNAPLIHAWPELTAWDNKPTMAASSEYPDYFVYEVPADRTEVNALFVFDGVKTGDQTGITQDSWFTVASNGSVSSTTIPPTPPTTPVLTVSNGGVFTEGTTQSLVASATLNADIRYTVSTTGTPADPTSSSMSYTGAISVSADATYKFIAFNGTHASAISTVSYTFEEEQPGFRIYARKEGTTNAPLIHAWPELTQWDTKPSMDVSSDYPGYFVYEVPADRTVVNALFVFDGQKTEDLTNISQDTWFTVSVNNTVSSTTTPPTSSRGESTLSMETMDSTFTEGLIVAPSPASSYIDVRYPYFENTAGVIEIYNMGGALVFSKAFQSQEQLEESIDISRIDNGIHILRIQSGSNQETIKFSIVR